MPARSTYANRQTFAFPAFCENSNLLPYITIKIRKTTTYSFQQNPLAGLKGALSGQDLYYHGHKKLLSFCLTKHDLKGIHSFIGLLLHCTKCFYKLNKEENQSFHFKISHSVKYFICCFFVIIAQFQSENCFKINHMPIFLCISTAVLF